MAPGPSPEGAGTGLAEDRLLLQVARQSVAHALAAGRPPPLELERFPQALRAPGASFVTLRIEGRLRGCLGTLEARRALVLDVAENAVGSALRDPRFAPVAPAELEALAIELSLLGPLEAFGWTSEEELVARLRPGVDGLVIEAEGRRATFLPAVWSELPEPRDFLAALRRKAGLLSSGAGLRLQAWRYLVRSVA
jgi:AmmeMemoRadiSam system protein A